MSKKTARYTSSTPGVHWVEASNKWRVMVYENGRQKSLGLFERKTLAEEIRKEYDDEKEKNNSENKLSMLRKILVDTEREIDRLENLYGRHIPETYISNEDLFGGIGVPPEYQTPDDTGDFL